MKRLEVSWFFALTLILVTGCGDDSSSSPEPTPDTAISGTTEADGSTGSGSFDAQEDDALAEEDVAENTQKSDTENGEGDASTGEDASEEEVTRTDKWPYGGPHPVGVTIPEEKIVTESGRELSWMMWYPAQAPEEEDASPYLYLSLMQGQAYKDALPAEGGPWPIILFSHGNQGIKEQSFFLTEHLASHGYLVVAPDHQYNTALDFDQEQLSVVSIERPKDISAVLDRVLSPADSDPSWLDGFGNDEHVGVTGHSFGGYTSLLVGGTNAFIPPELQESCETTGGWICDLIADMGTDPIDLSDPRVGASLPMAPAGYQIFTDDGLALNQVPTMVMTGSDDQLTGLADTTGPIYDGLPAPKYLWLVEGGDHYLFSDLCKIPGIETLSSFGNFEKACSDANPAPHLELHPPIQDAALAFFNLHLMGVEDEEGLLTAEGAADAHPTVSLTSELD